MIFDLTDELADAIQSALENQDQKFLVDAKSDCLVTVQPSFTEDKENYYTLPDWDSAAGFKLREDFVNVLHAPLARENLQDALHSGKGVFRNFKDVIKSYPEVEKLWHSWKNRKMRTYIDSWYNDLRELWGLELLDQTPEDNDDLVHDDFTFQKYDPVRDRDCIFSSFDAASGTLASSFPDEINEAVSELWRRQFEDGNSAGQAGFICHSLSGEFAGCITAAPVSNRTQKIVLLTCFFVPETFRGLGIGSELFSLCLSDCQKRGKEWILIANTIVPDTIQPLLFRTGFEKTGSGFAAKLK
jgi:hypothetical protein